MIGWPLPALMRHKVEPNGPLLKTRLTGDATIYPEFLDNDRLKDADNGTHQFFLSHRYARCGLCHASQIEEEVKERVRTANKSRQEARSETNETRKQQ